MPLAEFSVNQIRSDSVKVALAGVEEESQGINFTVSEILAQNVQSKIVKEFQRAVSLVRYLIKTDNQINYLLFKTASSNPKSKVILGLNDHLIERNYIRNANRFGRANEQKLNTVVEKLKRVQSFLSTKGVNLIFVISPNKPSFYPEVIPPRYVIPGADTRFDPRQFITAQLRKEKVNFIDGFELLKDKERILKEPMFATSGTHWNELGGCLVASEIMKKAQSLFYTEIRQIDCQIDGTRERPVYQDTDLLQLANF